MPVHADLNLVQRLTERAMQIMEFPGRLEHCPASTRDLPHQLRLYNVKVPPQVVYPRLHPRHLVLILGKSREYARAEDAWRGTIVSECQLCGNEKGTKAMDR